MTIKNLMRATLVASTVLLPMAAHAAAPGKHPLYFHALGDLRSARWLLEQQTGDDAVHAHKDAAIHEIDAAIGEIQHASIDDGKAVGDHPAFDRPNDPGARLQKADALLRRVHNDVSREEDDAKAQGLKDRALAHIDAAEKETVQALHGLRHK